jgi:sugar phosphate isomerase/epimerase
MNKIYMSTTTLPDAGPLEFVEAAAEAGYDGCGFRLHKSPAYPTWQNWLDNEPLKREVKRAIGGAGIRMIEMLSYYVSPDMDLDEMAPSLEYGALLGAKYALVIGREPDWNRQVDNFGKLCELIGSFGLVAAIEVPVGTISPMEKAFQIVAEARQPNAALCIDPSAFYRAGDRPEVLKGKNPQLMPYTQINDGKTEGGFGRMRPGDGDFHVAEFLDALTADVPLSLEWPQPRGSNYTPLGWARFALDGTRRFLADYYGLSS